VRIAAAIVAHVDHQRPGPGGIAVLAAGGFFVLFERIKEQTELLPKLMLGGLLAAAVIVGGMQYARWRDLYGIASNETHSDLEAMVDVTLALVDAAREEAGAA
jgi:hypothetical protein